jgi:hypothetical protein
VGALQSLVSLAGRKGGLFEVTLEEGTACAGFEVKSVYVQKLGQREI